LTDLELNPLVIVQRIAPTNLGMVDEQIFSATVDSDKAKALIAVEPFDGSLCHALNFLMLADLEEHTAASLPDAGLTLVRTVGSGVALLAAIAQNTDDDEKRDKLLDYILTIPPLTQWPPDHRKSSGRLANFSKSSVVTSDRGTKPMTAVVTSIWPNRNRSG
jgi:hypothetical protein